MSAYMADEDGEYNYTQFPPSKHTNDGQIITCPLCGQLGAEKEVLLLNAKTGEKQRHWMVTHTVQVLNSARFPIIFCERYLAFGEAKPRRIKEAS